MIQRIRHQCLSRIKSVGSNPIPSTSPFYLMSPGCPFYLPLTYSGTFSNSRRESQYSH